MPPLLHWIAYCKARVRCLLLTVRDCFILISLRLPLFIPKFVTTSNIASSSFFSIAPSPKSFAISAIKALLSSSLKTHGEA